jgi:hypothetical protein
LCVGAAKIYAFDWCSVAEAVCPHVIWQTVAVEGVPAGEAGFGFDVWWTQDLDLFGDVWNICRGPPDRGESQVYDFLTSGIPIAFIECIRRILREDTHDVFAPHRCCRCDRRPQ